MALSICFKNEWHIPKARWIWYKKIYSFKDSTVLRVFRGKKDSFLGIGLGLDNKHFGQFDLFMLYSRSGKSGYTLCKFGREHPNRN
jgi:hypothetical protein